MTHSRGRTTLGDGSEVSRGDPRVVAAAQCEDATASVGVAIATAGALNEETTLVLGGLLNDLIDVSADLLCPRGPQEPAGQVRIDEGYLSRARTLVDHYTRTLPPLTQRILPGGTVAGAVLHRAHTATVVAERLAWAAVDAHPQTTSPLAAAYLHEIAELLLVLARRANAEHGDMVWHPGLSAVEAAEQAGGVPGGGVPAGTAAG